MPEPFGIPAWCDLTVDDADTLRDFYAAVLPWQVQPTPMGEYDDYTMCSNDGLARGGVCHRRGMNAGIPPVWIIYFTVPDLPAALAEVTARGGEIVEQRGEGDGALAVIRDPAGAVCALYQSP